MHNTLFHIFRGQDVSGQIATTLNGTGIEPPRPRAHRPNATWYPTAIREMLYRELYAGRITWNSSRFVKVHATNKRVRRVRRSFSKDDFTIKFLQRGREMPSRWQIVFTLSAAGRYVLDTSEVNPRREQSRCAQPHREGSGSKK